MSNIGSTALQTSKQEQKRGPQAGAPGPAQSQFMKGTRNMLDDARQIAESAAGQGMQLNPMIYQMLGLNPTMGGDANATAAAQADYSSAQQAFDTAQKQMDQLKAVPKGKRSPDQKKQLRQLKQGLKQRTEAVENSKARFNDAQSASQQVTGFSRMDPSQIDASSPFSSNNPLNQAQATESQRLNQYLQGGEVDPTLKHQYDQAEQALRAQLTQRFGPDYESSSVGQMALQNFSRQKNEAFATWNQQQVEKYNSMAFGGAQNLQQLLAGQIGLMREPASNQMGDAANISNLAGQRISQEQANLQERAARHGLVTTTSGTNPVGLAAGGAGALGQLLTTPYNQAGSTLGGKIMGTNPASPDTVNVPSYDAAAGGAAGGGALNNWLSGESAAGTGTVLANNNTGIMSWLGG